MTSLSDLTDIASVEQRHLQRLIGNIAAQSGVVQGQDLLDLSLRTATTLIARARDDMPEPKENILSWIDYFLERVSIAVESSPPSDDPTPFPFIGPSGTQASVDNQIHVELADAILEDLRQGNLDASLGSAIGASSRAAEVFHSMYLRMGGLTTSQLEDHVYGHFEELLSAP